MNIFGIPYLLILTVVIFIGSLLLMILINGTLTRVAISVSSGVIAVIILRIAFDLLFWDSTSHNLAPFEIIIKGAVAVPCAFAGAYLGTLIKPKKNNLTKTNNEK
jgi:uncharacterized membrane protein YjfL (UPF0719 family)